MVHLGATWGQRLIWVQTGDLKHTHKESEKRESVPRVSTSLVHLTHVGPTYLTSESHLCHVAVNQWSMSAATSPGRDKCPDLIGPHQHNCHMAACEWSTAARERAMWQHTEKSPQHVSATWQSPIGPPQQCGPHHYTNLTCGPHLCHVSAYDGGTSALNMPHGSTAGHTHQQTQSYSTTFIWHLAAIYWAKSAQWTPLNAMWHSQIKAQSATINN
jgi:hypothetical protein